MFIPHKTLDIASAGYYLCNRNQNPTTLKRFKIKERVICQTDHNHEKH